MKIYQLSVILVFILSVMGCSHTRTAVYKGWNNQNVALIAVLPFNHDDPLVGDIFGERISDALITELLMKGFSVVERQRVEEIMKEHALQMTGAFDPSTISASGLLIGVDYIVTGSLVTSPRMPSVGYFLKNGKKIYVKTVQLRWIDVESGQILACSAFQDSYRGSMDKAAESLVKSLSKKISIVTKRR